MDRQPAVAGRFYPASPAALAEEVATLLAEKPSGRATPEPPLPALGMLAPHAGYMYSGAVAGATYARVDVPERAIVLCPNHTGMGERVALWPSGGWLTPLGRVPVDEEMVRDLRASGLASPDREAHRHEHSAEVQLPFLQLRRPEVAIAALCLGPLSLERCRELGTAIAAAARRHRALVLASSDMSHYLPARVAREKDQLALERLLALDPTGLYEVVRREDISMCGYVPATVMLFATKELGAREVELVRYGSSADATGDDSSVVGYAGAVVL
ncbi:MAG TPA: AmmeMemoRadiSam system protein B [Anaeromyxobacteraceae bacterium]|nr:AmmeMemoRadiSam system protein B [Anaeromyxobacteraceae bacterium]